MKILAEAFHHTLKDIYYAENALTKALPNVAKAAGSADLKKAVETHLEEAKKQITILNGVFKAIGEKPGRAGNAAFPNPLACLIYDANGSVARELPL